VLNALGAPGLLARAAPGALELLELKALGVPELLALEVPGAPELLALEALAPARGMYRQASRRATTPKTTVTIKMECQPKLWFSTPPNTGPNESPM
jgi:uncharacterized membrane protein